MQDWLKHQPRVLMMLGILAALIIAAVIVTHLHPAPAWHGPVASYQTR